MKQDRLTAKDMRALATAFTHLIDLESDTVSYEALWKKLKMHNSYVKAFDIFMEYFDQIDDENKLVIDKQLKRLKL